MTCKNLIDGNGVYTTRGGRLVFISGAELDDRTGETRYRGYMVGSRNRKTLYLWYFWSANGRFGVTGDHEHDLVLKV